MSDHSAEIVAIVPVKSLGQAKSRLQERLTPDERERLVMRLLDSVLAAVRDSRAIEQCLVVSRDARVLDHARARGVEVLDEGTKFEYPANLPVNGALLDASYNRALELARAASITRWNPSALLVLAADLPWLTPDDIAGMIALGLSENTVVVAPDRLESGTNCLLLRPPEAIPFRFGRGSFEEHYREVLSRGLRLQIHRAPGTAIDIDQPEDLEATLL